MVTDKNKCWKCPGFFLFQSTKENWAGNMEGKWRLANCHCHSADGEVVRLQVSCRLRFQIDSVLAESSKSWTIISIPLELIIPRLANQHLDLKPACLGFWIWLWCVLFPCLFSSGFDNSFKVLLSWKSSQSPWLSSETEGNEKKTSLGILTHPLKNFQWSKQGEDLDFMFRLNTGMGEGLC